MVGNNAMDSGGRKTGWNIFTGRMALILIILIPAMWVARKWLALPETILGATIMGWTLILQFYFRKKDPSLPDR